MPGEGIWEVIFWGNMVETAWGRRLTNATCTNNLLSVTEVCQHSVNTCKWMRYMNHILSCLWSSRLKYCMTLFIFPWLLNCSPSTLLRELIELKYLSFWANRHFSVPSILYIFKEPQTDMQSKIEYTTFALISFL